MVTLRASGLPVPHVFQRIALLLLIGVSLPGVERCANGAVAGAETAAGGGLRILRQPDSVTVGSGGTVLLSVIASGPGTLRYQWRKDGIAIEGAVNPVFQRTGLLEEDAGVYGVDVIDGEESVSSAGARINVLTGAPVVLAQTPSQSVAPGSKLLLRVYARGAASVTYQWRKGGVPISGATGAAYAISSVQLTDAGRYDVLLRNEFGTVQSMPVVLGVAAEVRQDFQKVGYRWFHLGEMLSGGQEAGEAFQLPDVEDLALDAAGNLYFADAQNHVIRRVSPNGVVTVAAGSSGEAGSADGALAVARFDYPQGIALDEAGNLFVADTGNNTVRKVTPQGQVSTLAGEAGDFGISGEMVAPRKAAVDRSGTVYVLDNETVRKVVADRRTVVVFGGLAGSAAEMQPYPTALAVDSAGRLYVAAIEAGTSKLFVQGASGSFTEAGFGGEAGAETGFPVLGDLALGDGRRLYASSEVESTALYFGDIGAAPGGATEPLSLFGELEAGVLPRALTVDSAGNVYLSDSLTRAFLVGIPEGLPALSGQPVGGAFKVGEAFELRSEVEGGGEFSYQWFKGTLPVVGATGAVLRVGAAEVADSGVYRVELSSRAGRVLSYPATVVVSPPGPSLTVLRQPGTEGGPAGAVKFLKGTAASIRIVLDPAGAEALGTEFSVHSYADGKLGLPVGIGGVVPATGELTLPLRAITASGTYVVRFTRRFASETLLVNSEPFVVELQGIEALAGSYEVLLRDASGGLLEDGAIYRGVLLATVSKTGAVSGRVFYNEAPFLQGAPDASIRAYTSVTRPFSSVLAPSPEDPLTMVCSPKLGVGSSANRQRLQIAFDLSGARTELTATLTDIASTSVGSGCLSQGAGGFRCVTKLSEASAGGQPVNMSAAAGRYVLSANTEYPGASPAENNLAQLFVQVLPTGRILWAINLAGSTGTGSAGLAAVDQDTLVAQFYEGSSLSNTKSLSTQSLLGILKLSNLEQSGWGASVEVDGMAGALERQVTFVTKDQSRTLVYSDEAFATPHSSSSNWSKAGVVAFDAGDGCRWAGSTKDGLAAFLWPGYQSGAVVPSTPFYLSLEDPQGGESFSWKVTVSSTGVVRTSPDPADAVQPTLMLRLDRTRGMWSGSYVYPASRGVRRTLLGASVKSFGNPLLRAKGWSEMGALPATRTGSWELIAEEGPQAP
jgi:hypothetical protein